MASSLKSCLTSNMTCVYGSSSQTETVSEMPPEKKRKLVQKPMQVKLNHWQTQSDRSGEKKSTPLLTYYDKAPAYLQNNHFIRTGYRVYYSTRQCVKSVFSWSNETINIWTHLIGLFLFIGLLVYDIFITIPKFQPTFGEKIVMIFLLICYQATMALSVAFHVFSARSEQVYYDCLRWDVAGIILSFTAIFVSGIHYAYACFSEWRTAYELLIGALATVVLFTHLKSQDRSFRNDRKRLVLFLLWAIFGVVPTAHWAYLEGGFQNPIIQALLPRVAAMYIIVGIAFFFYVTRYPERCCPGKVDYFGSSHQLWHVFVVLALWWWHDTGIEYAVYRQQHTCAQETYVAVQLESLY